MGNEEFDDGSGAARALGCVLPPVGGVILGALGGLLLALETPNSAQVVEMAAGGAILGGLVPAVIMFLATLKSGNR